MVGPFVVPMKLSWHGTKIPFRVSLQNPHHSGDHPDEEVGNILARDEIVNIVERLSNSSQAAVDQYIEDVVKFRWFIARLLFFEILLAGLMTIGAATRFFSIPFAVIAIVISCYISLRMIRRVLLRIRPLQSMLIVQLTTITGHLIETHRDLYFKPPITTKQSARVRCCEATRFSVSIAVSLKPIVASRADDIFVDIPIVDALPVGGAADPV